MARIRLAVPAQAKAGDQIEIKALIQHKMESGYRYDARGKRIERDIIVRFECRYQGAVVFAADFGPGIAANPFLSFFVTATQSGPLEFIWTDQQGETWQEHKMLNVT